MRRVLIVATDLFRKSELRAATLDELARQVGMARVFRDTEPRRVVFALLGMSNWVYKWYAPALATP